MKGFAHYLKFEFPDYLNEYQGILAIPLKKTFRRELSYDYNRVIFLVIFLVIYFKKWSYFG